MECLTPMRKAEEGIIICTVSSPIHKRSPYRIAKSENHRRRGVNLRASSANAADTIELW